MLNINSNINIAGSFVPKFNPLSLNPVFAVKDINLGQDLVFGNLTAYYISGTGLDSIYDFTEVNTALGDNQLNKNAYYGNSFGLPHNYDFPYSNMYFDTNNPAYWKLTDFHYKNFNIQSLTTDDTIFLRAKATTDTSNIIESVSELYIFSSAQASEDLNKLKAYIGIQPDFLGDNVLLNSDFSSWTGDNPVSWVVINESGNTYITEDANGAKFYSDGLNANNYIQMLQGGGLVPGNDYMISLNISSVSDGTALVNTGGATHISNINEAGIYEKVVNAVNNYIRIQNAFNASCEFVVREIKVYDYYLNCYSS